MTPLSHITRLQWFTKLIYTVIATILVAFLILPPIGQAVVLSRFSKTFYEIVKNGSEDSIIWNNAWKRFLNDPRIDFSNGQDRITLWHKSFDIILKNPFGYGPFYERAATAYHQTRIESAHNTILELTLKGGVIGLIICIAFLIWIARVLYGVQKDNWLSMAFIAALCSLLVTMFFIDGFMMHWFWVLIAINVLFHYTSKNLTPSS